VPGVADVSCPAGWPILASRAAFSMRVTTSVACSSEGASCCYRWSKSSRGPRVFPPVRTLSGNCRRHLLYRMVDKSLRQPYLMH
jgi:hypothetical protein